MTETKQALDAVVALVADWNGRDRLNQSDAQWMREKTYEQCANELEDLLPALTAYIHRIETSHPSYDNAVRIRQLEEQVEQLQAALGEAGKDSERLDALQRYVDEAREGMLLLHNGNGAGRGILGLGLANFGRTLREAVDASLLMDEQFAAAKAIPAIDAMAAGEDAK